MRIVILGLSITSSWGNGHATTYRSLIRELVARDHEVLFLERDQPWYAENRDLPDPPFCQTRIYHSTSELRRKFGAEIGSADCVIVGSYVPDGAEIGRWISETATGITGFYDIDTPVTLSQLKSGDCDYLSAELIPLYNIYLSFTGGPVLRTIEQEYGSPMARPLYCSVDPTIYFPERTRKRWVLGYLGTFSADRETPLSNLLLAPATMCPRERFVVAGPMYPKGICWPPNVERITHLSPAQHRRFYNAQRFTLNITRAAMVRAGFSPSVRLFEAAACGIPIISDRWAGLDTFFEPDKEIFVTRTGADVIKILREVPAAAAAELGKRARERVLAQHTAAHRAAELESFIQEAREQLGPSDFQRNRETTEMAALTPL